MRRIILFLLSAMVARWVYLINEIASTVITFNWNAEQGTLEETQSISTLPRDFQVTSTCAEIETHPKGRYLYCSNRGHDSLAIFAIDQTTGALTPQGEPVTVPYPFGERFLPINPSSSSP